MPFIHLLTLVALFFAYDRGRARVDAGTTHVVRRCESPVARRIASLQEACEHEPAGDGCARALVCNKGAIDQALDPVIGLIGGRTPPLAPTLQTLVEYAEARGRHALKIKNGRALVDIGFLSDANDQVFMAYLYGALKEGLVEEIQTGTIIGPKVLALLLRLNRIVPPNAPLRIKGRLSAAVLETIMSDENTFFDKGSGKTVTLAPEEVAVLRSQNGISKNDVREFKDAVDRLGVKRACLQFYHAMNLRLCGELDFEFDARYPDRVHWRMAPQ